VLAQPPSFIDQIGLGESLTQARANGLSAMVKQVKLYGVAFKSLNTPR
jgi:cysteine desulfuration protein SufE